MSRAPTSTEENTRCVHRRLSKSTLLGRLAIIGMATAFGLVFIRMGPNADIVGGVLCLAIILMALLPEPSTLTPPNREHDEQNLPRTPTGRSACTF